MALTRGFSLVPCFTIYSGLLWVFLLLPSSSDVADLSSPSYQTRQRAAFNLTQMGLEGVKIAKVALAMELQGQTDWETVYLLEYIIDSYYAEALTDLDIGFLPSFYKDENGKNLAKSYYERAESYLTTLGRDAFLAAPSTQVIATRFYLYDLLERGEIKKVRLIKKEMEFNRKLAAGKGISYIWDLAKKIEDILQ